MYKDGGELLLAQREKGSKSRESPVATRAIAGRSTQSKKGTPMNIVYDNASTRYQGSTYTYAPFDKNILFLLLG